MCGFAGFFDPQGLDQDASPSETVRRMVDCLHHRGPDDHGVWVDAYAGVALGHRRLSIVDLSPAGHQPMVSASGRFIVAFNGEIYNHVELRERLGSLGIRWRGHSDTEVLVEAIEHYGVDRALRACVGMFAFALWDSKTRSLVLARDRIGEKPLYVGRFGSTLVFGSELKALRAHPRFEAVIDREALSSFVQFGHVPSPLSIFAGVQKLPAGSWIRFHGESWSTAPEPTRYWNLADVADKGALAPFQGSYEDAVDELEQRLSAAVRLQRVADVPLGAFLSGGIDSSVVTALMQAQSSTPVRTFTIGFAESDFDEAQYARQVADHYGTAHTEQYVTADEALGVIPLLPTLYDEPFGDASALPTYLLSALAKRDVTVALTGDGGDEMFLGYVRYRRTADAWRAARRIGSSGRAVALALSHMVPTSLIQRFMMRASIGAHPHLFSDRYASLVATLSAPRIDDVYRSRMSRWTTPESIVINAPRNRMWAEISTLAPELHHDSVARMAFIDALTYLPDDVLTKVDRATMAVSLEARVPILDHRVVEFAWSLPTSMKWRGDATKRVLTDVLRRYLPEHLIDRPKMGFGVPIAAWLRGPLRDWAEDALSPDRLASEGFFEPEVVRSMWTMHVSGHADWQHRIWPILVFQEWLRHTRLEA